MPLTIKVQQTDNNKATITLAGQINSETCDKLDNEVNALLAKKIKTLAFDMAGVDFINSSGIGIIIKAKMSLLKNYGDLAMLNPQPQIRKVFDIMKLLPAMNVFASIKELDDYLTKVQKKIIEGEEIYE